MKVLSKQKNSKMCIICGLENELGVKAPFYNMEDGSVASVFKFSTYHQSYPERTHGGIISAMLDELMDRAIWCKDTNIYGVTTSMTTKYRKPTPFNEELIGVGYITNESSRFFVAKGKIFDKNLNILAESEANYIKLNPSQFTQSFDVDEEMKYETPCDREEINLPPQEK